MPRRALLFGSLVLALGACSPARRLSLVSVLPSPCGGGMVNAVRVRGLGDFAPLPAQAAALDASGTVDLALPRGTRVVTVEGIGPAGVSAMGRTALLELPALWDEGGEDAVAALAYGPGDAFCATGNLAYARSDHHATLLVDGSVLLSGGVNRDGLPVVALERYLPTGSIGLPQARFVPIGAGEVLASLDARAVLEHDATRLDDGRVLLSGGAPALAGRADGIAYEGARLLFSDGRLEGPPRVLGGGPRARHAGLLLADGRVLLTGGCTEFVAGACAAGRSLASAILYDPARDEFSPGPSLLAPRSGHRALFRDDGLVLIVGGRGEGGVALAPELYDPTEARGAAIAGPGGAAVSLASGLVIALSDASGPSARATSWSGRDEAPVLLRQLPSERSEGSVTTLEDGTVLFAGGWDGLGLAGRSVVLGPFGAATEIEGFAARGHTATRLLDGSVLLAGGTDASGRASAVAAVFLRSLVGPFDTPPTIGFDDALPLSPSRPERILLEDGALLIDAGAGARSPERYALVPGAELAGPAEAGFELSVLVGRTGAAEAALLFGEPGSARYVAVRFAVGAAPSVLVVRPDRPGLPTVDAPALTAGCSTEVLVEADLPEKGFATLHLRLRQGALELWHDERMLLRCVDARRWAPARGRLALGAMSGRVRYDNVSLLR